MERGRAAYEHDAQGASAASVVDREAFYAAAHCAMRSAGLASGTTRARRLAVRAAALEVMERFGVIERYRGSQRVSLPGCEGIFVSTTTLPSKWARVQARHCLSLLVILFSSLLAACDSSMKTEPAASGGEIDLNARLDSSSYYVGVADMSKLVPGRSRRPVLQDLRWKSASVTMADLDGKSICAVTLALYAPNNREAGVWFHAIFVDDVLLKLIRYLPGETEEVPYQGTFSLRAKPVTVGDRSWLVQALDAPQVSVEELEAEARTKVDGAHDQVDIGLTIVMLLLGPALALRTESPSMGEYRRNNELRDQFNALHLDIGMTASEVERLFNAKPLEVGKLGGGSFSIYGSSESFGHGGEPWTTLGVHFSNVLVVLTDGKVSTVHSVSAKGDWRRNLEERFLDLPRFR